MAQAQAMIDEVGLLEAALREAVDRKRGGLSARGSPGGGGSGREVYSEVLKEHFKFGAESAAAPTAAGAALMASSSQALRERFDTSVANYGVQLKSWVDMQVDARLNSVIRSLIAEEMALVREETEAALETVEVQRETLATVENVMATVDELKRSVARDNWAEKFVIYDRVLDEMQRMHVKHEASLADVVNSVQLHDQKLQAWRSEITGTVNEEIRLVQEAWRQEAIQRREIEEIELRLDALVKQVEAAQTRLSDDLVALVQRLVAELRQETTVAFKNEASSIKALDEQIWLTDQQLRQRVEELLQSHQQCVTVISDLRQRSPERRVERVEETVHIAAPTTRVRSGGKTGRQEVHVEEDVHITARDVGHSHGNNRSYRVGGGGSIREDVHIEEDVHVTQREIGGPRVNIRSGGGGGTHKEDIHIEEDVRITERDGSGSRGSMRLAGTGGRRLTSRSNDEVSMSIEDDITVSNGVGGHLRAAPLGTPLGGGVSISEDVRVEEDFRVGSGSRRGSRLLRE